MVRSEEGRLCRLLRRVDCRLRASAPTRFSTSPLSKVTSYRPRDLSPDTVPLAFLPDDRRTLTLSPFAKLGSELLGELESVLLLRLLLLF